MLLASLVAPDGRSNPLVTSPGSHTIVDYAASTKAWHIRLPRADLLAAWQRLVDVQIPGVPDDQRFHIEGQTFYVSPEGNDANEGSRESPWRTLGKACAELKPNTVIYLRGGRYFGPVRISTRATADAPAALRGAEGEEVTVTYRDRFVEKEKARIAPGDPKDERHQAWDPKTGKARHYPPLIECRGTYVEISGLRLVGVRDRLPHNLYSECGILFVARGGPGCRVLYNEIENVGHCGVKEQGHGGHSFLVEGNLIHDVGQTRHDHCYYSSAKRVTLRRNILINAAGLGVNCHSLRDSITVTHNILGGNASWGMCCGGPNARIVHNVFYRNRWGGVCFYRLHCRDSRVLNNIFIEPSGRAIPYDNLGGKVEASPQGCLADYNCLAPGTQLGMPLPGNTHGEHNFSAAPGLASPDRFDFRLRPGSPCIDAGLSIGQAFHGRAPDVGIYEGR